VLRALYSARVGTNGVPTLRPEVGVPSRLAWAGKVCCAADHVLGTGKRIAMSPQFGVIGEVSEEALEYQSGDAAEQKA